MLQDGNCQREKWSGKLHENWSWLQDPVNANSPHRELRWKMQEHLRKLLGLDAQIRRKGRRRITR